VQKNIPFVDGRNLVEQDAFIDAGFVYKGIGKGDIRKG